MKLSFGPSEPWNNGWRGWSDSVEVFVDGRHVGDLKAAYGNRKELEYCFVPASPRFFDLDIGRPGFGIRAAKTALRDALASRAALT